jgi:subtilisin family serine protease
LAVITGLLAVSAAAGVALGQNSRQAIDGRLERVLASAEPGERISAWVYFADKPGLARPADPLVSERSLERRRRVLPPSMVVDQTDLPVDERYVSAIVETGALLRERSKWLNAVSLSATSAQIRALAALPFVRAIEPLLRAGRSRVFPDAGTAPASPAAQAGPLVAARSAASRLSYGASLAQVTSVNAVPVHDAGNGAEGILIGVFDNGFRLPGHKAFAQMNVVATYDFVDHKVSVVPRNTSGGFGEHGVETLSTIGGYAPGSLIGPAYGASYILLRTENDSSETPFEEDKWIAGIEWADSIGVQVTSTSLGYLTYDAPFTSWTWQDMNGRTTPISRAAAMAVRKGILVVNSAGNNGIGPNFPNQNTLNAPADADSVLTVGALTPSGSRASFSSVGPTTSNPPLIKPDVMAQGSSVVVASPYDTSGYTSSQGTSFSCPLAAGAAALILKAVPTATPMQIVNAMRSTASRASTPDNAYGWGAVNTVAAINALGGSLVIPTPLPAAIQLDQNYPNPFNPKTRIGITLSESADIRLTVYDLLGRQVAMLAEGRYPQGPHTFEFDGSRLASGAYVYRLSAGGRPFAKRMMLIR